MLYKALLKNPCRYGGHSFSKSTLEGRIATPKRNSEKKKKKLQMEYDTQFHLLCQQADNYTRLFFKSSLRCVTVLLKEESYF